MRLERVPYGYLSFRSFFVYSQSNLLVKGVRVVRVKNLVAGHHRHQIFRLRQIDDIVSPAGNHVDSLNFVPGNFKLHRFSSVDVSLLNQSVTPQ